MEPAEWPVPGQLRVYRGHGWQVGQVNDERFMNFSRLIGAPHREQGKPS